MKIMKMKRSVLTVAALIAVVLALQGCNGGGGGAGAPQKAAVAVKDSSITGKVSITGLDNCSTVVVVAEKGSGGVTSTVARMMLSARASPSSTPIRAACHPNEASSGTRPMRCISAAVSRASSALPC